MSRQRLFTSIGIITFLIVAGGVAFWVIRSRHSPIPSVIDKQVSYIMLYPEKGSGIIVDTKSFKFEPNEKILSFTAITNDSAQTHMTVTEQATPSGFTDIPQAYDKFVESLQGYTSFGSAAGTVNLTRPPNLDGSQAAVVNTQGTMMFVHPVKDLPEKTWRQLFNNLKAIK